MLISRPVMDQRGLWIGILLLNILVCIFLKLLFHACSVQGLSLLRSPKH